MGRHQVRRLRRFLLLNLPLISLIIFLSFQQQTFQRQTAPQPDMSRFIKVNEQGEFLSPWQGPWHCVLDTQTGMLWEAKSDDNRFVTVTGPIPGLTAKQVNLIWVTVTLRKTAVIPMI
ncbi:hypothetical protein [Veronia pacifica]|uniref:Uncharacterized protein n=1 Tax=Veronia pacifica TaxID=1080227 RepID=A0A1C3EL47_9GAMM|nr:hypothetical protein [Veronia pacifica]ODA33963.1 hypothetical protein A8L45_07900 [Veronia pacifica]